MKKLSERLLLLAVLGIILCPLLFFNWKSDQISAVENRALAEKPTISSHPDVLMNSIDSYVDDRIGFRDEMMQLYNRVVYDALRGNHGDVIVGEDGWLFYADDLPDYTGSNINEDVISHQVEVVKAIDAWCQERGITFVLAVGPNKSTIYHEFMPNTIAREPNAAADRLVERLRQEGVRVVYPKQALLEHKSEQELYYRLDTHWNAFGSRYLLEELTAVLALEPMDIPVSESTLPTGDLLTMLGTGENGTVSVQADVPTNPKGTITSNDGGLNLMLQSEDTVPFVCYRDSFSIALANYYSHYFSGPMIWSFGIDPERVEQEAPQVLILSAVERYLGDAISQNEQFLTLISE